MKFRDDYAAANVPMLPVVAPAAVVARKIVIYSWAMVAATLALVPYAGWLYGACAAGLGGWFLAEAHRLRSGIAAADQGPAAADAARGSGGPAAPMRLFHLSIAYLTLLFAVVAITSLLPFGRW
jgi:protoheme IX farnesyltransferase